MLSHQAVLLSHSSLWRSVCVHFRSVARCQYFQLKPNQIEVTEINGYLNLKKWQKKNWKKLREYSPKRTGFLTGFTFRSSSVKTVQYNVLLSRMKYKNPSTVWVIPCWVLFSPPCSKLKQIESKSNVPLTHTFFIAIHSLEIVFNASRNLSKFYISDEIGEMTTNFWCKTDR